MPPVVIPPLCPGKRNCAFNRPVKADEWNLFQQLRLRALFWNHGTKDEDGEWNLLCSVFVKEIIHKRWNFPSVVTLLVLEKMGVVAKNKPSTTTPDQPPKERTVSLRLAENFWQQWIAPYDRVERLFYLFRARFDDQSPLVDDDEEKEPRKWVTFWDFVPLLQEVVRFHPSVQHLLVPGQEKLLSSYCDTVITRIFYTLNTSRTGYLTLREFRRFPFEKVLHQLSNPFVDINEERDFFSYKHFLVLRDTFVELDSDRDHVIRIKDVQNYHKFALTPIMVNRVYQSGQRGFTGELGFRKKGAAIGMNYFDFIYFMLSDIDKTKPMALKYWFQCLDIDGEGVISYDYLRRVYQNQYQRLLNAHSQTKGKIDLLNFESMLAYLQDRMYYNSTGVVEPRGLTWEDFYTASLNPAFQEIHWMESGHFFHGLCNLQQFLFHENKSQEEIKVKRLCKRPEFKNPWSLTKESNVLQIQITLMDAAANEKYVLFDQEVPETSLLDGIQPTIVYYSDWDNYAETEWQRRENLKESLKES